MAGWTSLYEYGCPCFYGGFWSSASDGGTESWNESCCIALEARRYHDHSTDRSGRGGHAASTDDGGMREAYGDRIAMDERA